MSMNTEVTSNAQLMLKTMLKRLNLTLADWIIYQNLTGSDMELGGRLDSERGEAFCGESVLWLRDNYRPVHGYLALVVCIFGSVANLINIVVLTRKDMLSPTNAILTGLATADIMVMLEYILFAYKHYISNANEMFSYSATLYVLFHAHFTQIFHTIAIWMTVMLAVWRFLSIVPPQTVSRCCNMRRSRMFIVGAYVVSPIICIPSYFTFALRRLPAADGTILYRIDISGAGRAYGGLLNRVNFWVYSVLIKLVPCLALTYFSVRMIRVLLETKRRKQRLMNGCLTLRADHHLLKGTRQTDRTTWMLVAVLLLFLLTEFPQGILALLSGILQDRFFRTCYLHVGELLDILALTNSAVNFLLYCLMSKQFCATFCGLLRLSAEPCRRPARPVAQLRGVPPSSKATDVTSV